MHQICLYLPSWIFHLSSIASRNPIWLPVCGKCLEYIEMALKFIYIFWSEGFTLLLLNCWKESLPWVRLPGHLTPGSVIISPTLETGAPSLFLLHIHVRGLWAALPCFSAINTVVGEDKVLCHNSMSSSLLNQLIYIATPCLSFPTC